MVDVGEAALTAIPPSRGVAAPCPRQRTVLPRTAQGYQSRETLQANLEPGGLYASELRNIRQVIHSKFGHPFELEFSFHKDTPRSAGGEFEEFRSEI